MKDRLLTLLLAVGAFVAFYFFFIGPQEEQTDRFSRPLSTEKRANGYFALRHWLETQGIPVTELHHRFDWLERAPGLPRRGNLLVTTIPHKREMRHAEQTALRLWLRKGNDLLVIAGLFDTPEWGMPDYRSPNELYQLTGLSIVDHEDAEAEGGADDGVQEEVEDIPVAEVPDIFDRLDEPKSFVMAPVATHPLTRDVGAVHAVSEHDAGKFDIVTPQSEPVLALMADRESGLGAFWITWRGESLVMVSGFGSIFTNKVLAQAGNAALAANIVAASVGPGGHVIFDDMHQGAASVYDAQAFFADPRLHVTFWWIMGFWLLWVMGSTRLPPPAARPVEVRERAFVSAVGNFFARVIGRKRASERLFANFLVDCRRAMGEPHGELQLWDRLRGLGSVPRAEIDRLAALHARVTAGKRVNVVDLHNRLQHLWKRLS